MTMGKRRLCWTRSSANDWSLAIVVRMVGAGIGVVRMKTAWSACVSSVLRLLYQRPHRLAHDWDSHESGFVTRLARGDSRHASSGEIAGGVVRWRRIDLKRVIAERFGVDFHERYVGKLLKKLGFSHMSARPRHPAQDERIVEAFKKTFHAR